MIDDKQKLEERVKALEILIGAILFSDRFMIARTMQFQDGRNIQVAKGTGTKIGTEATQKLSFWGVSPVVQHSSAGELSGFSQNAGSDARSGSTWTGNVGITAYTVNDIVKALKNAGIMLV